MPRVYSGREEDSEPGGDRGQAGPRCCQDRHRLLKGSPYDEAWLASPHRSPFTLIPPPMRAYVCSAAGHPALRGIHAGAIGEEEETPDARAIKDVSFSMCIKEEQEERMKGR